MKKLLSLTLLVAFVFSSLTLSAQDDEKKKKGFVLGYKSGFNISNLKSAGSTTDIQNEINALYNSGVYIQYHVNDKLYFQPEALLTAEGLQYTIDTAKVSNPEDGKLRMSFFAVPINVVFRPIKHINLSFGPDISYLMKAVSSTDTAKKTITEEFNKIALGLNFGLGTTLFKTVTITGRYKMGVTDLSGAKNLDFAGNPAGAVQWFSNTFQISVGYNVFNKFNKQ